MDRYGLFIDAAYLYAAGGQLCCGTKYRNQLVLNFQIAVTFLEQVCTQASGLKPLRTYWYDAATHAQPTPTHKMVATIQGVQLRLGRLTQQGQKGVDSRIVRDLIVAAHHRSIVDAFLLSGDDDLREGVTEAQEMGVRVTLIGVAPLQGLQNQAPTLVQAADATIVLTKPQVSQFLSPRFPPPAPAIPPAPPAPTI